MNQKSSSFLNNNIGPSEATTNTERKEETNSLRKSVRRYWSELGKRNTSDSELDRGPFDEKGKIPKGKIWNKLDTALLFEQANGKTNVDWEAIAKQFSTRHNAKECKEWFLFLSDLADQKTKVPKRKRRRREDIIRTYKCTANDCEKAYGSEGALKHHFKLKHPNLEYTPRRLLYAINDKTNPFQSHSRHGRSQKQMTPPSSPESSQPSSPDDAEPQSPNSNPNPDLDSSQDFDRSPDRPPVRSQSDVRVSYPHPVEYLHSSYIDPEHVIDQHHAHSYSHSHPGPPRTVLQHSDAWYMEDTLDQQQMYPGYFIPRSHIYSQNVTPHGTYPTMPHDRWNYNKIMQTKSHRANFPPGMDNPSMIGDVENPSDELEEEYLPKKRRKLVDFNERFLSMEEPSGARSLPNEPSIPRSVCNKSGIPQDQSSATDIQSPSADCLNINRRS